MSNQMGEIFLGSTQLIGMKLEANSGTAESLSNSDYKFLVHNLKLVPKFDENTRKYAVGDPYPFQSIMGAQAATLSYDMDMQGSGATGVDPTFFTVLQACGFQVGATSLFRYAILQLPNKTLTCAVEERENAASSIRGKRYTLKGAGGTKLSIHYDGAGKLQNLTVSLDAALSLVEDLDAGGTATPNLTADLGVPASVLGITSNFTPSDGANMGVPYALTSNTMTIDFGLKGKLIEYVQDPTGYSYTVVTDFDPMINLNVLIALEATFGAYYAMTAVGGLLGAFDSTLGTGQYKELEIMAPNSQVVKALELGARDGIDSQPLVLRCLRTGSSANPCIGIFQHIT